MKVKGCQSEVRTRFYKSEAKLASRKKSMPIEPLPVRLLKRLKGRIEDWEGLADRFYKAREEDRGRILCEALDIKLRDSRDICR